MTNGRQTGAIVKEKISINIARLKKGGEDFEIVLKNPDLALEFKHGKDVDIKDILESEHIFKDAKKGELQSEDKIKRWLETDDTLEAAKIILRKGEIALTAEQRKNLYEQKRKKIIEYIHQNAADPKTGFPHPIQRIELAMDQAKVHIDANIPIKAQFDKITKELSSILPMNFEKMKIIVVIPAKYAGSAYGTLKSKYNLRNEKWNNDGSVQFEMEEPMGSKPDIYNLINKLANGEAEISEM